MHPKSTYELRVAFADGQASALMTKQRLIDWLLMNGVESFVEGALEVDYNHEYGEPEHDFYEEFGGDLAPISIYRYSRESLDDLRTRLTKAFGAQIDVELHTMATETWMEGWKESFRPFATDKFYVTPPWEKDPPPPHLIPIVIEPGMAFGTGQHATTRLCLEQLGRIVQEQAPSQLANQTVLDVGTGTGILAIGARLLGYGACAGTDIDDDAIAAAFENVKANQVEVYLQKASVPQGQAHDLVFANILAVVLLRIMGELASVVRDGGRLVLSGILVEEEQELVTAAHGVGLQLANTGRQDGWACLVFAKPTR